MPYSRCPAVTLFAVDVRTTASVTSSSLSPSTLPTCSSMIPVGELSSTSTSSVASPSAVHHRTDPADLAERRPDRRAVLLDQPGVRLVREERPPVVAEPDLLREVEVLDRRVPADPAPAPHADVRQQPQQRRVQIRAGTAGRGCPRTATARPAARSATAAAAADCRSPTPPGHPYRDVDEPAGERAEARDEQAHESDLGDHDDDPMLWRMTRSLVIKVTAGADAPERCSQAFTVAATAVAAGVGVSLWLTGESAWFALPGRAAEFELPHSAPLEDLLDAVLAAGTVTLCTQCAARREITTEDTHPGGTHRRRGHVRRGSPRRRRPGAGLLIAFRPRACAYPAQRVVADTNRPAESCRTTMSEPPDRYATMFAEAISGCGATPASAVARFRWSTGGGRRTVTVSAAPPLTHATGRARRPLHAGRGYGQRGQGIGQRRDRGGRHGRYRDRATGGRQPVSSRIPGRPVSGTEPTTAT